MVTEIKEVFIAILDAIDQKLRTRSGRTALLIMSCVIFGGSIVHSYNMNNSINEIQVNIDKLEKDKIRLEKDKEVAQETLNLTIKNATAECNEQIRQGAILQQELQAIYNNKTKENIDFVKKQESIIEEKKRILSIQDKNIKNLNNLNN